MLDSVTKAISKKNVMSVGGLILIVVLGVFVAWSVAALLGRNGLDGYIWGFFSATLLAAFEKWRTKPDPEATYQAALRQKAHHGFGGPA